MSDLPEPDRIAGAPHPRETSNVFLRIGQLSRINLDNIATGHVINDRIPQAST